MEKKNIITLKKDSNYYYQIQGQLMRITKRHLFYFFIFTPNWAKLEVIEYSETFWKEKMFPKLTL